MDRKSDLLHFTIMLWDHLPGRLLLASPPALHECAPGWSWNLSHFRDFDLWLVLRGEGNIETAGDVFPVSRGSGLLFRPGDCVHGTHDPEKPLRVFACHFRLPPAEAAGLAGRLPRLFRFHDARRCEQAVMELLESVRREDKGLRLQLAMLLLQAAKDAGSKIPDPVEKILGVLCVEIAADPGRAWEPGRMAARSGLSLPQFNRRFRALAGTSPIRYVIERRIDRARQLLLESPMPLQEIAVSLGYPDIYYFHRQFRAETGETPRGFRKKGSRPEKKERPKSLPAKPGFG